MFYYYYYYCCYRFYYYRRTIDDRCDGCPSGVFRLFARENVYGRLRVSTFASLAAIATSTVRVRIRVGVGRSRWLLSDFRRGRRIRRRGVTREVYLQRHIIIGCRVFRRQRFRFQKTRPSRCLFFLKAIA